MKSEVEERKKWARSCCHNYVFLMSLLVVSNDINHYGNLEGKSRVVKIVDHASCCYAQSRLTRLIGPITRHVITPLPPWG